MLRHLRIACFAALGVRTTPPTSPASGRSPRRSPTSDGGASALLYLAQMASVLVTPVTLQRPVQSRPLVPPVFEEGCASDGPGAEAMRKMWGFDMPESDSVSKFFSQAGEFVEFSKDKGTHEHRTLEFRFLPVSSDPSSSGFVCSARFVVSGIENTVVGLDPDQARLLLEGVMGSELCPGLRIHPYSEAEEKITLMKSSFSCLMAEATDNVAQMRRVQSNLPADWKGCAGFLTKDRPKRLFQDDCAKLLADSGDGMLPVDMLYLLLYKTDVSSTDVKHTFRHPSCSGFRGTNLLESFGFSQCKCTSSSQDTFYRSLRKNDEWSNVDISSITDDELRKVSSRKIGVSPSKTHFVVDRLQEQNRILEKKLAALQAEGGGLEVPDEIASKLFGSEVRDCLESAMEEGSDALEIWDSILKNVKRVAENGGSDNKFARRSFRYPDCILRLACTLLNRTGRDTYEELAELFFLPGLRTVQKARNVAGENTEGGVILHALRHASQLARDGKWAEAERVVVLCFDAMKVRNGLVFRADTLELIGMEDSANLNPVLREFVAWSADGPPSADLPLATDYIVWYMSNLGNSKENRIRLPIARWAQGPTNSLDVDAMCREVYSECRNYGFDVRFLVCDGASENRKFIKSRGVTLKTIIASARDSQNQPLKAKYESELAGLGKNSDSFLNHPVAILAPGCTPDNPRYIWCISDMPHCVKKTRNATIPPAVAPKKGKPRELRRVCKAADPRDSCVQTMSLQMIKLGFLTSEGMEELMYKDDDEGIPIGLNRHHWMTIRHFGPDRFARMRTPLAMQVLSESAARALEYLPGGGPAGSESTAQLCRGMNRITDIFNSRPIDMEFKASGQQKVRPLFVLIFRLSS